MRGRIAPLGNVTGNGFTSSFRFRGRSRLAPVGRLAHHTSSPNLYTVDTGDCAGGGTPLDFEVDGDWGDGTTTSGFALMIGAMKVPITSISAGGNPGTPSYITILSPSNNDYGVATGDTTEAPFYVPITVANAYGYANSWEVGGTGYFFDAC